MPREALYGASNAAQARSAPASPTVRNVGAGGYSDVALRDAIDAGEIPGPRLLVSGPGSRHHGRPLRQQPASRRSFTSARTASPTAPGRRARKVREVIKYGADVIKICASRRRAVEGRPAGHAAVLARGDEGASSRRRTALGRKVAAHAHGTQSIKEAIAAGVDSIEHASLIDDEGIRMAKEHGTFLVMDIYNDDFILQKGAKVGMLPESIEKEKKLGRLQRENFRTAVKAGVQDGLRHRRRRLPARRQREAVRLHGQVRHDADAGDPVRDGERRRAARLEGPGRRRSSRASSPTSSPSRAIRSPTSARSRASAS